MDKGKEIRGNGYGFGFGKEGESLKGGGAACKGPDRLKSAALLTVHGLMP